MTVRKPKAKKAVTKAKKKPAKVEAVTAKRAQAYADMEGDVCDLVNMGTIAMDQFDKNEGLFIFAVGKLEDMLNEFKAHYYAEELPI
jgi:AAA+ superfamily predicted ATPase